MYYCTHIRDVDTEYEFIWILKYISHDMKRLHESVKYDESFFNLFLVISKLTSNNTIIFEQHKRTKF